MSDNTRNNSRCSFASVLDPNLPPTNHGTETPAESQDPPRPICSVLTTVIDHVMVAPTPLEPEEYREVMAAEAVSRGDNKVQVVPPLLVPVVRIFGPILRRDHNQRLQEPSQSACLYIHGAFPYLYARPVIAGPDSSLHKSSHHRLSDDTTDPEDDDLVEFTDWDDVASVQKILPILVESLEASIQSSMQFFAATDKNKPGAAASPATTTTTKTHRVRVIRRIQVVVGRGFYTYCPGSPAPFLRVEYYNPSERWRIKAALERGIDVPSSCHANPAQYQPYTNTSRKTTGIENQREELRHYDNNNNNDNEEHQDGLCFHCYEAHISYTMQFFKDWNMAGMSYVHLSHALFRTSLPKPKQEPMDDVSRDLLFLDSNTPSEWIWASEELKTEMSASEKMDGFSCSDSPFQPAVPLTQPSLPDEDDDEMSESEHDDDGKRAASLSTPPCYKRDQIRNLPGPWSDRGTSCNVELDVIVQHILNVHDVMKELPQDYDERQATHWRAVPSLREMWQEERRRMAQLLRPQDDFLSRSQTNPDDDDDDFETPPFTLNVKKDAAVPGARLACEGMKRLVQVTEGLEDNFRRAMKDIVNRHDKEIMLVDEALQRRAHGKLRDSSQQTPTDKEAIQALEELGGLFDVAESSGTSPPQQSQSQRIDNTSCSAGPMIFSGYSQQNSASTSNHRRLSQDELFQLSSQAYYQTQDRSSLANSKIDDFELSQRLDRGDPVIDGPFQNIEDCINAETLTPYDTIDDEDHDDFGEEGEMDECRIEQTFQKLATQTIGNSHDAVIGDSDQHKNLSSPLATKDHEDERVQRFDPTQSSNGDEASVFNEYSPSSHVANDCIGAGESVADSEGGTNLPIDSSLPSWLHPPDVTINRLEEAPLRKDLLGLSAANLLPLQTRDGPPSWMPFSSEYEKLRGASSDEWFPTAPPADGINIQPTRPAPSRKTVASWSRRLSKRALSPTGSRCAGIKRPRTTTRESATKTSQLRVDKSGNGFGAEGIEGLAKHNSSVPENHFQGGGSSCSDSGRRMVLSASSSHCKSTPEDRMNENCDQPLEGIGQQGGKIWVEGGGQLKAKTRLPSTQSGLDIQRRSTYLPKPVSVMSIEVHVQCRIGRAGVGDSNEIALTPDSDRDKVFAIVYVYGRDPGGGEAFQVLERGCLFVPVEAEVRRLESDNQKVSCLANLAEAVRSGMPLRVMGCTSSLSVECVSDERQLLLRISSIVRLKDPDMLISWDTQGAGLGYLIERGVALGKNSNRGDEIDLARLMGRTPTFSQKTSMARSFENDDASKAVDADPSLGSGKGNSENKNRWKGSGLGTDWDERVGAGAAAASIVGRLVFAGWKIVAEEVKHPNASYLQAVASSVLGKRIPFHDNLKLTEWYSHNRGRERWRVCHHKLTEATATLQLLDQLDVIGRAGEAARLSGVEFYNSFPGIRGSQYKVEGVLLRALQSLNSEERGSKRGKMKVQWASSCRSSLSDQSKKSQTQSPWKARRRPQSMEREETNGAMPVPHPLDRGYFFYSPSLTDTNKQEALRVQALTLEPQSGHHQDPVVVLDFVALYPSLIIAYNLCYSTVAGALDYHSTRFEMRQEGRTTGKVGPFVYAEARTATVLKHHLKSLADGEIQEDRAYMAPTGTIYVSESVVKGVLPQVLDEMLSTRAMLKKAAKEYKRLVPNLSLSILRQLEARQLALKYVANVTYGYTSATFSGRCAMPLLADTIVECGRRTLTGAINLANEWGRQAGGRWQGCKVLYGDTDSVFVKLPGRSVEEAFQFGEELCKAVTASNPPPVALKLEKVYLGSIMQTKKKYCGLMFESVNQRKPTFEAKGLETVRRDQCPLTQKILRNSLIHLFQDGIDAVKSYLYRQWALILSGQVPVSDFILTGRVRSRYRGGKVGPVQAALARRLAEADPGRVVRHRERLAYAIVATPGVSFTLRECVVTPMELLERWDAYTLNTAYYIKKHVNAALQRCLGLAPHKIDIESWYTQCPKPRRRIHFWPLSRSGASQMISSYFGSDLCSLCGSKCRAEGRSRVAVCSSCRADQITAIDTAMTRLASVQNEALKVSRRCSSCNLCFEDATTFAETRNVDQRGNTRHGQGVVTPLANCSCIDCPTTYERHRLRETELEVLALCDALDSL